MKHKSILKNVFLIACTTSLLLACAPTLNTRGNFLDDDQLKTLETGVSTKQEVAEHLGTPTATDPFDQNTWMYIGEKTETEAFFRPKVTARRVLKVKFDETGLLSNVEEVSDKDGKAVELVQKTTPASGQEMNAFQQFMGNLGKFNSGGAGGPAGQSRTQGQ